VEWTNRVFRDVLPSAQRRQSYEAPFQALQSEEENAGNGLWKLAPAKWHLAEENALADFKMPAELRRQRAGRALARFLRALQDDATRWNSSQAPELQFPDLSHISQRMARGQNAIGIVFTSHAVKSIFEGQLRAFEVPFVAVKGTGFWSSEPVIWTLHWLKLLLDASDQTAFVGLARCALGGLSDVALLEWHLALRNEEDRDPNAPCFCIEGFLPSRDDDARAWQLFTGRLMQWRELARVEAASEVLEAVLEGSELAFYEAGLPDCAQREENWRKVLDILREREAEGAGGLRALIDHIGGFARDAQNGDKEADAPLPSEGSIGLMTVWAAKGLGFPMTILAQLDDAPQSRGANLLRGNLDGARQMAFGLSDDDDEDRAPKPWLWERLKAREAAEEEAQWRRLFYVACTRAEGQLVLLEPEGEVKNGAAWSNLCGAGWNDLKAIEPVEELARGNSVRLSENVPVPDSIVSSLPVFQPQELHLRDLAGDKAEKFESQARTWMERELEKRGAGEEIIREDVPFSAPASALAIEGASWVVGAWEWLAVLPNGEIMLVATGQDGEIASNRVKLMALAARDAGFEVSAAWALWPRGEETGATLVGTWHAMSAESTIR
ncbi:MAG TPA: 3'-5' exonuclease, partial [Abditibacterium sp.]